MSQTGLHSGASRLHEIRSADLKDVSNNVKALHLQTEGMTTTTTATTTAKTTMHILI
jgi:hypothetical protein